MAMDDRRDRPLLNPVLSLRKEPLPTRATGGGPGEKDIIIERLGPQRRTLAANIDNIVSKTSINKIHGGRIHLLTEMFGESLAPTWTPTALFDPRFDSRLVAPAREGYLAEVAVAKLPQLSRFIRGVESIEAKVAISRVKEIRAFNAAEQLRGRSIDALWDAAADVDGGKAFILWLAPFKDAAARTSVISTLQAFERERVLIPSYPSVALLPPAQPAGEAVPVIQPDQTALARAARRYRNDGVARSFIMVPSKTALTTIAASGASFRIDPVRRIEVTAPGAGAEPVPPVPDAAAQPVVAVIDGGLTAASYLKLEAWRAPPLVPNRVADHAHGNRVTSLVVQAHAWNNQLQLPTLTCRVATVQAVPREGSNVTLNSEQMIDYLRQVTRAYPEARVWNMSFNQIEPEDDPGLVSFLGHEVALLAREAGILPVISIGNRRDGNPDRLCAPADCEAAITVGGRMFDGDGHAAGKCPVSLKGPGPDGMLKPDVSWFSHLRMLGGAPHLGSSYAVPLVSSLAAHTFTNLKEPSADLVRALLINASERETHDAALGWGTPWSGHMPWTCAPGSVTLTWRGKLRPGFAYYWNDIPIPPEMIHGGKLVGSGKLTAILNPMVSQLGGSNYFSTRVQVALQYQQRNGAFGNLLGSMKEDKAPELEARSDLAKWQPVRRHIRDFSKRGGISFRGDTMRLHARIFARDLFQFDIDTHNDLGEQDVAFVLTLSDGSDSIAIYNSVAQRLGNFVESAIIEQPIEVEQK